MDRLGKLGGFQETYELSSQVPRPAERPALKRSEKLKRRGRKLWARRFADRLDTVRTFRAANGFVSESIVIKIPSFTIKTNELMQRCWWPNELHGDHRSRLVLSNGREGSCLHNRHAHDHLCGPSDESHAKDQMSEWNFVYLPNTSQMVPTRRYSTYLEKR